MLIREYQYTYHPSRAGACVAWHALASPYALHGRCGPLTTPLALYGRCVAWHALAASEPRLPECAASCVDVLHNTSLETGFVSRDARGPLARWRAGELLPPLPAREADAAERGCLAGADGATVSRRAR